MEVPSNVSNELKQLKAFEAYFTKLQSSVVVPHHEGIIFRAYSDEERSFFLQYTKKKKEILLDFCKNTNSSHNKASTLKSASGPMPSSSKLTVKEYPNNLHESVPELMIASERRHLEMEGIQDELRAPSSVSSNNAGVGDGGSSLALPITLVGAPPLIPPATGDLDLGEGRPTAFNQAPPDQQIADKDNLIAGKIPHSKYSKKEEEGISSPNDLIETETSSHNNLQQNSTGISSALLTISSMLYSGELQENVLDQLAMEPVQNNLPKVKNLESGIISGITAPNPSFGSNSTERMAMEKIKNLSPRDLLRSIFHSNVSVGVGAMETTLHSSSNGLPVFIRNLPPPLMIPIPPSDAVVRMDKVAQLMTDAKLEAFERKVSSGTLQQEALENHFRRPINTLPNTGNPVEVSRPFPQVAIGTGTKKVSKRKRKAHQVILQDNEADLRQVSSEEFTMNLLNNVGSCQNSSSAHDSIRIRPPAPLILRRKKRIDNLKSDEKKRRFMLRRRPV